MELIHARLIDNEFHELSIIQKYKNYNNILDEESTIDNNDFELELMPAHFNEYDIQKGDWLYIANSEWGGQVTRVKNSGNSVFVGGPNFRGLMTKRIIPPNFTVSFGSYLNVDLELNEALKFLYEYQPNHTSSRVPYFTFSDVNTGVKLKDTFRFEQYLKAVTKRLKRLGYRLQITHDYLTEDKLLVVSAEKIIDYSDYDFYNEDSRVKITSTSDETKEKKYLICLGKGELSEREVVVLVKENGVVKVVNDLTSEKYKDFLTDTELYDFSSAESTQELIKGGTERLLEDCSLVEEVNLDLRDDVEYFLGDIIGGYDEVTNIKVKQSVIKKELNINSNGLKISYKLGGI